MADEIKILNNVNLYATPTDNIHITTKGYVDTGLSGKADIDHDHHVLKTLNNKTISLEGSPSIDTYLVFQDRFINGFNSSSSYSVGSVVSYNGNFWKCTTAHSGAWNSSHFTKITLKNYIDEVASGKANATHTHSGSDITSGTISTSYLPAADGTSAGIVSVAANSGLVASNGALSVNVTDGNGLSKNATTGAITVRSASTSAYGTVRIASSVASDSSYVVPSSLLYSTLQNYVPTSDLTTTGGSGQNGKVVQLNSNGLIDTTMVPKIAVTDTFTASSESQMTGLTEAEQGDICIRTDLSKTFILTNNTPGTASNWKELATPADTVTSVNTKTGAVTLTASDVGAAGSNHVHASLKNGATLFSPWLTEDTHAVNMGKIAPKFSESQAYAVGDLCYRNDVFYRCSTAHPAGAWDASHFTSTNIKAYIDDGLSGKSNTDHTHYYLKNGNHTATAPTLSISTYIVIQDKITPSYDSTMTYSAGDTCSRYGRLFRWKNATDGSGHAPISGASGTVDSIYWEEITVFDYVDSAADGLGIAPPFDSSEQYSNGDRCVYKNKLYVRNEYELPQGVETTPEDDAYWYSLSLGSAAFYDVSPGGEYLESNQPKGIPVLLERQDDGTYYGTLPEACTSAGVGTISISDASETIADWADILGDGVTMFASGFRYRDTDMGLGTYIYCRAGNTAGAVDHLLVKVPTNDGYFTELALTNNVYASLATPYDDSTTYSAGDICSYNGQLYKWTNNSSGSDNAPPDTDYWTATTVIGSLNSAISSHTHSGSAINSGTVSASYLPTADTTNKGVVSISSTGGLSVLSGAVSVNITTGNGLNKNSTTGAISVSVASTSAFGTVKITSGNGLGVSSGVVSMAKAGTNPGAVKVTTGNGLAYDSSTGAISLSTATTSAAGTVQLASSIASGGTGVPTSGTVYTALGNYVLTSNLTTTGGSGKNGKVVQLDSNGYLDLTMIPEFIERDIRMIGDLSIEAGPNDEYGFLNVAKSAYIDGAAYIEGGLSVTGPAEADSLSISGDTTIGGDVSVEGGITSDTLSISGNATFGAGVFLDADPETDLEAATKQYVDTGLSGKSDTSHTHDKLKKGSHEANLPTLTTATRLVVQEKIATEYNGSTTYSKGDTCVRFGRFFKYINSTSSTGSAHPPITAQDGVCDTTYWEEIVLTGYIDSQDANLRATLLTENIAETYSASRTYNYGDICSYNGQIYIWANGASGSNHLPTDTDYWSEAVVMDSVDIKMSEHTHSSLKSGAYTVSAPPVSGSTYLLAQESIVPAYNSSTSSYAVGTYCSYNGKIYRCKQAISSAGIAPTNTTYWEVKTLKDYVDAGLSGKANSTHSHTATDLPTATTSARGIVQVGSGLSVSNGVVSVDPSSVNAIMGMGVYTKLANLSTPTVALADDTALYKYTIAGNTTLAFDSSNLTMTSGTAITFELYLVMPATVYTVTFPNTVSWLNNETPSMSTKSKTYMLTFRSIDGGATWLGSKEGCY